MTQPDHLVIYNTEDGAAQVELIALNNTVWLSQKQMAKLFNVTTQAVSHHLRILIREGEIRDDSTFKQLLQEPGQNRSVNCYSLEAILAVGFRIRGPRGTQFRQWANTVLTEYLSKGFVLDDQRLKNDGESLHFDELLERIREIRASERMFHRKITDVIAASSDDYNPRAEDVRNFFASIQNKLHFAVHGKTAAELVISRADANKKNLGMTSWKGDTPHQSDITTAKNYLNDDELKELNRIVTMYLDYAEDRARRRKGMLLSDWIELTDKWLVFNEREVLSGAGTRSAKQAKAYADNQWEIYQQRQDEEINRVDLMQLENDVKALRGPKK